MNLKRVLRSFLGIPLTVISFLFIAKVFFDGREQIASSVESIKPELFFLGLFFYSGFFAIKSFIWIKILKLRGHDINARKTIYDYSISEIKRYIPGSIFAFIGRVDTHKSVPRSETLKGIAIEALLLVLSALVVSVPALGFYTYKFIPQFSFLTQEMPFAALLIFGILFFFNKRIKDITKKYFDLFFLFTVAWTVYALGSLFILLSLTFIEPQNFITAASIFAASWLGGYLLFVTPMGLGARELIATYGLSFFVSPAISSAIAVISRISMIAGELLFLLTAKAIKDLKESSKIFKVNPYLVIVIVCSILYFLFFSYYSFLKHDTYLTGRFDLGNMDQTIWNTLHGRFFTLTNPDGINSMSRLGVHSDIFLIFMTPFYAIWDSPKVLLLFQSLSMALSGIVIYLVSKKITKNEILSVIFSLSFYSNFWIHEQNLFDFHAVTIATLFLLLAFYFLLKKKLFYFFSFLILAATTKENILLIVPVFGLYFLLKRSYKLGLLLTILPLVTFYVVVSILIPNARGGEHFAIEAYKYLGDSPIHVIRNTITNPSILFGQIINFSTFDYINNHLFPTGYLALLSPFYLLFTLPDAAIYLLSSNFGYRSYQYHFGAAIVPFIYIASIYSVSKITKKFRRESVPKILSYYLLFFAIFMLYNYSPIPGMKSGDTAPFQVRNIDKINDYLALIPKEASVAASNSIGAHLSHREKIYVIPFGIDTADYVIFYREPLEMKEKIVKDDFLLLVGDEENNFYLYKRKASLTCASCKP